MKRLLIVCLLCVFKLSAQAVITKKDGTKIEAASVRVEANNKRIAYFEKEKSDPIRIKFEALNEAIWGDFIFRTFTVNQKEKGYYVMAETATKTLVSNKRIRVKSVGGFESTYVTYEVAVLDKQNNWLQSVEFTDENSDKKSAERAKVIPMINQYFGDCPELTKKAALFESPPSDTKNTTILVWLNDPTYLKCQ